VYATVGRERRHINTQRGKERARARERERERVRESRVPTSTTVTGHSETIYSEREERENGGPNGSSSTTNIQRPVLVSRACVRVVETKRGAPNIR
jgi:hypothetical protein